MTDLLERQLIALSQQLDVDVGERLVVDVMRRTEARLVAVEQPLVRRLVAAILARRRLAVAALALTGSIVVVLAIPNSRDAVADWFGIGSTRIERRPATVTPVVTDSAPTTGTAPTTEQPATEQPTTEQPATEQPTTEQPTTAVPPTFPRNLDLGQPISTAEARELTGLPVPVSDRLGTPAGVFVVVPPSAGQIIVVYPASATLPASPVAGVGALLSAVSGRLEDALFTKIAGPETSVESISITAASGATVPAVWLEGEPHEYFIEDAGGAVVFEPLRLATNTLLWMQDGVVFRLEAELTREQAVDIAATVVPAQ